MDVTAEMYPYTAGASRIDSALYDNWRELTAEDFQQMLWPATGERLTRETFEKYRASGGVLVQFVNTEELVQSVAAHPLTMIASDGSPSSTGHPRTAGTFARILGHYVRELKALTLNEALRKMTVMPAARLEGRVPAMKNKGRVRVGADADLVVFDAQRVIDQATYEEPLKHSTGMRYVMVDGSFIVSDGQLVETATPGQAVRAPVR